MAVAEDPGLDAVRAGLTDLLLRAPRRRHTDQWRYAGQLSDRMGQSEDGPVVGIATSAAAGGEVLLLLSREADFDTGPLQEWMKMPPVPIRTVVTGRIRRAARPAQGGDSVSGDGLGGDTGTLGCLVRNQLDYFVLGCNHTLAGINQCTANRDTVRQPGAADGGGSSDTIGTLTDFVVLKLGGYFGNQVDAAIAEVSHPAAVASGVRSIGSISGTGLPLSYGDRVSKQGWTTGYTTGTYRYKISYSQDFPSVGSCALFIDQYGIVGDTDPFAALGDSGAALLTESGHQLVGMVIGVADRMNLALASPIGPALAAFGVGPV